jgi:hypothetical protein
MDSLLGFLKQDFPVSVLSSILISLSYLSKERFNEIKKQCGFVERVTEFFEYFKKLKIGKSFLIVDESSKKEVIELYSYLFNVKDKSVTVDKKKFENNGTQHGDVVFEYFSDEIS